MSKAGEARQVVLGKCGHKIQRIRNWRKLEWRCLEGCPGIQEFGSIQLQPKGKASR
jgi:hypothetical protein